ncbi:MAG: Tim44 domain-containing protein [Alphaproteobacteria bacterium]|nr:Tim44 domain-containing protein [Alphaproteobacteria bacterium]
MNNQFQSFDLIFLAAIAGYLIYRLYSVLGQRGSNTVDFEPLQNKPNNVIRLKKNKKPGIIIEHEDIELQGIKQIQKADPNFNVEEFLKGAQIAFEIIVTAFNQGDKERLKPLLDPHLYKHFIKIITQAEKAGEIWDHSLVRIQSAAIEHARLSGLTALITVKFVSEQIHVIRDSDEKILEGDPDQIEKISDFWTFSRDTTSRDPNWLLSNTDTPS